VLIKTPRPLAVMLALYSFFLVPFSLHAQDLPVFRAATDIVMVPVTVTDGSGRFVFGLTADQFELSDEGNRRPLLQFSTERVPVSLGILLDISGSMLSDSKAEPDGTAVRAEHDARWADTRRALELLVTRLDPRDEVLFAMFNEKVALAAPWTQDHGRILRAFDNVRPSGTTALFNAVSSIAPAFQLAHHSRKVILVISDGQDSLVPTMKLGPRPISIPPGRGSKPDPSQVHAEVQNGIYWRQKEIRDRAVGTTQHVLRASGADVYAIGVGTQKGASVNLPNLEDLTTQFGGYIENLRSPSEIAAAVARICDDLQAQYLLAFEPARADGKFHTIEVRIKGRRLTARTRAGYMAPAQKQK
jgi:Ca-activated chloride channel homolog